MPTGIFLKRERRGKKDCKLPRLEIFKPAVLRNASKDSEGYYLKIDCGPDKEDSPIQMYVHLDEISVEFVVADWGKLLEDKE